jgi:large subunit ribosomal protein L3
MGKSHRPRRGSMQYWPRKRAKRAYARVKTFAHFKEAKLAGFCGYKVGMTHLLITDNKSTSMTKGQNIFCPVTIIECPPIKTASILFYKKTTNGLQLASAFMASNLDKELKRKTILPKKTKKKIEDFKPEEFDDIAVLVYTQPKLTTIGKKKPELFRLALGGSIQEKFEWAKTNLGKDIQISDILKEGQSVDAHAITKGKGFQGPVKRFGVAIRQHKSEKTKRGPGNLGAWHPHHGNFTVAHAGQMGYHQRTEYNKWLIKIGKNPEEINSKSGFKRYGLVKNNYVLIKGSISGPAKRLIILINPIRPNKKIPSQAPAISYVSK